jgi:hypothetical protein
VWRHGNRENAMGFDERQAERYRLLERVMLAAQSVAILYLAAHVGIAWMAYREDGVVAALVSLVLLGFGDLYWGLRWAMQEGRGALAGVALTAAAVCFASWVLRPRFDAWARQITAEMLTDLGNELDRVRLDRRDDGAQQREYAGEDTSGSAGADRRAGEEDGKS